jgi:tryptophan synthase beta subunit
MSNDGSTSYKVAKWIHHRLQTNGKIHYSEVEDDESLTQFERIILKDAINGLVEDKILHCETTYDSNNKKEEKVIYSKNIVL